MWARYRPHEFHGACLFFCHVDSVETAIWLTGVAARRPQNWNPWRPIRAANEQASPDLLRGALKMATRASETMGMPVLITCQSVNAIRGPNRSLFRRGRLTIASGIFIRDRLRVLPSNDPNAYYARHEFLPDAFGVLVAAVRQL